MSAISFQGVSKTYLTAKGPFTALNDVSFDIRPGEFFGLLGPNGAGKTTLISILAGLTRASAGRVTVNSFYVVTDFANARRALGVVPQELVFDPFFSVREALRFQSGYFGIRNNGDWIDELLAGLGLAVLALGGAFWLVRTVNLRQPAARTGQAKRSPELDPLTAPDGADRR